MMKGLDYIVENIVCLIIFLLGVTSFMISYNAYDSYINSMSNESTDMGVISSQWGYEPLEELYDRDDIAGILMSALEYDIKIDGTVYNRLTFDFSSFDIRTLPTKTYRKELEYNSNGFIKTIVFKSI